VGEPYEDHTSTGKVPQVVHIPTLKMPFLVEKITLSYTNIVTRAFFLALGWRKDPGNEVIHIRYLFLEI